MLGDFLTRLLVLILGYAYPAFECFKSVEKNKVGIDELRFWCQYWILVGFLIVFEHIGEVFISWELVMYTIHCYVLSWQDMKQKLIERYKKQKLELGIFSPNTFKSSQKWDKENSLKCFSTWQTNPQSSNKPIKKLLIKFRQERIGLHRRLIVPTWIRLVEDLVRFKPDPMDD